MAFWKGIEKLMSGLEEVALSPFEAIQNRAINKRSTLSGLYSVHIDKTPECRALVVSIKFNAVAFTYDLNLITYKDSSKDVWDDLSVDEQIRVADEIKAFLRKLYKSKGVSPPYRY
jgi:hypothetical protein